MANKIGRCEDLLDINIEQGIFNIAGTWSEIVRIINMSWYILHTCNWDGGSQLAPDLQSDTRYCNMASNLGQPNLRAQPNCPWPVCGVNRRVLKISPRYHRVFSFWYLPNHSRNHCGNLPRCIVYQSKVGSSILCNYFQVTRGRFRMGIRWYLNLG